MDMPPLVLLVWEDAETVDATPWVDNKPHEYTPKLFHQVGFLLSRTDAVVVLTQAWHPDQVAARDQIPAGMVRSITPLMPAPEPKKRRR